MLRELPGPDAAVTDLVFSPDGRRLAVVCGDAPIGIWDPENGTRAAVAHGHTSLVGRAAFSPDSGTLATVSADRMVRLHDAADGRIVARLRGHEQPVSHLAWSPAGDRLVTAGDATIRLWDATADGGPAVIRCGAGRPRSLRFTADGGALVSVTSEGRMDAWDVATASRRPVAGMPVARGATHVLASDRDGGRLLVADGDGVSLRDGRDGAVLASVTLPFGGPKHAAIAPDGAWIAVAGRQGEVVAWHPDSGRMTRLPGHAGSIRALAFRPGHAAEFVTIGNSGRLLHFDAALGTTLREIALGFDMATDIAFSPDGARLALAGRAGRLCVMAIDSADAPLVIGGHDLRANAVAWNPDGTRLVTGSDDRSLRLWDAATGRALVVLEGHGGPVTDVAVSPDGRLVASASVDGTIRLWGRSNAEIDAARRSGDQGEPPGASLR